MDLDHTIWWNERLKPIEQCAKIETTAALGISEKEFRQSMEILRVKLDNLGIRAPLSSFLNELIYHCALQSYCRLM
jgi:hypothetical protein